MNLIPPRSGTDLLVMEKGRVKYGWHWLRCESGDWVGAKEYVDCVLQVRVQSPDFPTQQWRKTLGGNYAATGEWHPLGSFVAGV